MISDAPTKAANDVDGVLSKISAFVTTAKVKTADGLTWAEFGELMLALMRLTVAAADEVTTLTGPQKKALVLQGIGTLFDVVADRCVPMVTWPFWLLIRSPVRALVLAIASGAIEAVLPLVRSAT